MGGGEYQSLEVCLLLFIMKTGRVVSGQLRKGRAFSVRYFCCRLIGVTKATLEPATVFYCLRQNWVWAHLAFVQGRWGKDSVVAKGLMS